MITISNTNNSLDTLKAAIDSSGFLDDEYVTVETGQSSEYDSSTYNVLSIKDADDNVLFRYEQDAASLLRGQWISYASSSVKTERQLSSMSHTMTDVGTCANGIIVNTRWTISGGTYNSPIRIVRTNLGKLAFIHIGNSSSYPDAYSNQSCVAWGDVSPLRNLTFMVSTRMQALIAPMLTNSEHDVLSQTVKSGWMPYNRDYSVYLRAMVLNGHRFLTDGYFAIEDD